MSTVFVPKAPGGPVGTQDMNRRWVPASQRAGGELSGICLSQALVAGTPVHRIANNLLVLAYAGAVTPILRCTGIVIADAAINEEVRYVFNGLVRRLDWTALLGTALLTPDAYYYLGSVAGTLTGVMPSRPAHALLQLVGRAQDGYTLDVNPDVYEVDL